ncbi:MAG: hypothetical protein K0R18_416 [Bacillales bacterium]|jgi:hypothetical protein|nr:hypothetical protein [Bacillales bacterium]
MKIDLTGYTIKTIDGCCQLCGYMLVDDLDLELCKKCKKKCEEEFRNSIAGDGYGLEEYVEGKKLIRQLARS